MDVVLVILNGGEVLDDTYVPQKVELLKELFIPTWLWVSIESAWPELWRALPCKLVLSVKRKEADRWIEQGTKFLGGQTRPYLLPEQSYDSSILILDDATSALDTSLSPSSWNYPREFT